MSGSWKNVAKDFPNCYHAFEVEDQRITTMCDLIGRFSACLKLSKGEICTGLQILNISTEYVEHFLRWDDEENYSGGKQRKNLCCPDEA